MAQDTRVATRVDTPAKDIMNSLLTEIEMAEVLGITPRLLREWRVRRMVPFLKIRSVVRFDPADVREALKSFERKAGG